MYLCMALHAELDQEDDESTGTAELAFAALAESLARYPDARYEITRQRVFLLYRFPDYLVDAWIETFPREHKDNERLRARARALDAIARATLADARDIQRDFPERFDADNELNDIINTIPPPSPPRDPGNVDLTRELLHGYLKVKYSL